MNDKFSNRLPPDINVSRETEAQMAIYVDLLIKWNATVNLVSKTSINEIWSRHILDSVQIFNYGSTAAHWADLGSGGGLPGLVVAILASEKAPNMLVTLVESDQRKAAFLRHVSHLLAVNTHIVSDRIEAISPLGANIVSARALAPLPQLCAFASRHLAADGLAIFLKGKSAQSEIAEARKSWHFSLESQASITEPSSSVLLLKGISCV